VCGPKKAIVKKMGNQRWQPRNGCDGRLMAKFLITTIQVNFVPNPSEAWRRQHWIVIIKNFAISLPSQPFLGRHLGFHIFFHNGLFGATHIFFYSWIRLLWLEHTDITLNGTMCIIICNVFSHVQSIKQWESTAVWKAPL